MSYMAPEVVDGDYDGSKVMACSRQHVSECADLVLDALGGHLVIGCSTVVIEHIRSPRSYACE